MKLVSNYTWHQQNSKTILVSEMTSTHLFYSIRMLFNHSVPDANKIIGCKEYKLCMSATQRREALQALVHELAQRNRSDLVPWMWNQLKHMYEISQQFNTIKIE